MPTHYKPDPWLSADTRLRAKERRARLWGNRFTLVAVFAFCAYVLLAFAVAVTFYLETTKPAHAAVLDHIAEPDKLVATITAYTSSVDETDDRPWETASGSIARDGVVACPSRLEFGTRVVIDGKMYVCEDRMNPRYRNSDRFDVWHPTKLSARTWGIQTLEVQVIEKNVDL